MCSLLLVNLDTQSTSIVNLSCATIWCVLSCLLILTLSWPQWQIRTKQVEVVRNLFYRQLTVPLADHAQTLEEYKKWEQEQLQGVEFSDENNEVASLPPRISYAYQKAEQMCRLREGLESNISAEKPLDGNLLRHYLVCAIWYTISDFWVFIFGDWKSTSSFHFSNFHSISRESFPWACTHHLFGARQTYISTEEATGEPCRVQILYERAVSVFPVTHEIWLKYTQYLDANLKVSLQSLCRIFYTSVWKRVGMSIWHCHKLDTGCWCSSEWCTIYKN